MRQHHRKIYSRVTENKLTDKDKMTSSNNKIYELKCYLKFFKIVLDKIGSIKVSYANINFGCGVLKI